MSDSKSKIRRADPRARSLRKSMPPAESKLWSLIRRQQLGFKFRRQVSISPYYDDFACVQLRLVIELDGSQHTEDGAVSHDGTRDRFFEDQGWTVIRFWNHEVFETPDDVLWAIHARCEELVLVKRVK